MVFSKKRSRYPPLLTSPKELPAFLAGEMSVFWSIMGPDSIFYLSGALLPTPRLDPPNQVQEGASQFLQLT